MFRSYADHSVRNGSYRVYQRYLCKNFGRTFNDKTGTIFAHSKLSLKEWFFTIYVFLRFNTSIRQIEAELDLSYRTGDGASSALAKRSTRLRSRCLDRSKLAKCTCLPVSKAASATRSRARVAVSTRGRGSYDGDKPPVFTLVDRGSDDRYVVPAKSANESTVRLLLADHDEESLTVYTDGFRAYEPLEEDDAFTREYVVHGDGEYADGDIHVNTCESHASLTRRWLSPHRGISKDKLTPYLRAFQLRCELYRNPGDEALKHALDAAL